METEIVKSWIETYYIHPEGYNFSKPKNTDNLIKKEITCTIVHGGREYVAYCDDISGGPIISAMTIEEKKFKEAFLISLYIGGLMSADKLSVEKMLRDFTLANPKYLSDYKSGNVGLLGLFVGHVMKERKGKGDPKIINEITKNFLDTI